VVDPEGVQDIDNLTLQQTDVVFEGVWIGVEKIGEVLILSGANPFIGGKGRQITLDLFQEARQSEIQMLQLLGCLLSNRMQLLLSQFHKLQETHDDADEGAGNGEKKDGLCMKPHGWPALGFSVRPKFSRSTLSHACPVFLELIHPAKSSYSGAKVPGRFNRRVSRCSTKRLISYDSRRSFSSRSNPFMLSLPLRYFLVALRLGMIILFIVPGEILRQHIYFPVCAFWQPKAGMPARRMGVVRATRRSPLSAI
jgi:hypothetical protein